MNSDLTSQNIGVITPFNDESGIAGYSRNLYSPIESRFKNIYYLASIEKSNIESLDEENVLRCWDTEESDLNQMFDQIEQKQIGILHVQYHSAVMFSLQTLDLLVQMAKAKNIKCYLTLHAVRGASFDFIKQSKSLNLWNRIFIHNTNDYEYAKSILHNVTLFKHPTITYKFEDKNEMKSKLGLSNKVILGTHGLLNQHKNIPLVIKALAHLKKEFPELLLLCINAVSNNNIYAQGLYEECLGLIKTLGLENDVIFIKDFLNDNQIEKLMKVMDIGIYTYNDVGESASGAIGKSLAANVLTITSNINMFSEYTNEVAKLESITEESIVNMVASFLSEPSKKDKYLNAAQKYISENSYERKAVELLDYY